MACLRKYLFILNSLISFELNALGGIISYGQWLYNEFTRPTFGPSATQEISEEIACLFRWKQRHIAYLYCPEKFADAIRKMTPEECRQHASEVWPYARKFVLALRCAVQSGSIDYTEALLISCADKISKRAYKLGLTEASRKNRFDLFLMIIANCRFSNKLKQKAIQRSLIYAALNDFMDFAISTESWLEELNLSVNTVMKPIRSYLHDFEKVQLKESVENGPTKQHSLSLHAAIDMNRKNIALFLLHCGADPLVEDHEKDTAMTIVNRRAEANPEYRHLQLLLLLYINYRRKVADTGTHHLGHPIIFTLCPALVSVHNKDSRGNTLLHAAVEAGDWNFAEQLLAIEPLLFAKENNIGHIPLMTAIAKNRHEMMQNLIIFAYTQSKSEQAVHQQEVPA